MGLNKDILVFTEADGSGDNIGAYVRAGTDGDQIASQTIAAEEWLNVASALHDGSGTAITSTTGYLDVQIQNASDIEVAINAEYVEDSVAADGSLLVGIGVVRQDTLSSSVSADGDWGWAKMDSIGRLWTNSYISGQAADLTVDINAQSVGNISVDLAALSYGNLPIDGLVADDGVSTMKPVIAGGVSYNQASAMGALSAAADAGHVLMDLYRRVSVSNSPNVGIKTEVTEIANTETAITAAVQAGRQYVLMQNVQADKSIFIGTTGVTTAIGIEIPKKGSLELKAGESIVLKGIVATGTGNLKVLQMG